MNDRGTQYGSNIQGSLTSVVRSMFTEPYDLFGYYKPAFLFLALMVLVDYHFGNGLVFQGYGAAKRIMDQTKLLFPLQGAGMFGLAFLAVFLLVGSLLLFSLFYVFGHILHTASQFVEAVFVKAMCGYPTEWYLWHARHSAVEEKPAFRQWFYRQPHRVVIFQMLPVFFFLWLLLTTLWFTPLFIPDTFLNRLFCLVFLLQIAVPKLHVSKLGPPRSRSLQWFALGLMLLIYLTFILLIVLGRSTAFSAFWSPERLLACETYMATLIMFLAIYSYIRQRMLENMAKENSEQAIGKKAIATLSWLLPFTSNHLFFLYNTFSLKSILHPEIIRTIERDFRRRFIPSPDSTPATGSMDDQGEGDRLLAKSLWWHAFLLVSNRNPQWHKAIYHWLSLSGFARSLCVTFALAAGYYLVHPWLFSAGGSISAKPLALGGFMALLSLSYLFFYRFLYLYNKYYTKFTLRAAAFDIQWDWVAPATVLPNNSAPERTEENRNPIGP